MSEEQNLDGEPTTETLNRLAEEIGKENEGKKAPLPRMQYVFITLADGRKGAFAGPELVTRAEMTLNCVPRLVAVEFSPPREVEEPKPLAEVIQEVNSDSKESPATTGLEQKA